MIDFSPGSRKLQVYKKNLTDLDPNTLLSRVKWLDVLMVLNWTLDQATLIFGLEPLNLGSAGMCTGSSQVNKHP